MKFPPSQTEVKLSSLVGKKITGCFYDDADLVIVLDNVVGLLISSRRGGSPIVATEQGMALSVRVHKRKEKLAQLVKELKQTTALEKTLT